MDGVRLSDVEPKYQRGEVTSTIKSILKEGIDPIAFGRVALGRRGGRYKAIDGQQRTVAATRLGRTHVASTVYGELGVPKEAEEFIRINDKRTAVSPYFRFRASVTAGNPEALAIEEVLKVLGLHASKGKSGMGGIRAVDTLTTIMRAREHGGQNGLFETLWVIKTAYPSL